MEDKLFFHECRAAGIVFKTCNDWVKWLEVDEHKDFSKPVAEYDGFKYNINDVCINPHIGASCKVDNYFHWEVKTAKTQYGWIYGYGISVGSDSSSSPVCYPSRYERNTPMFKTEKEAIFDALTCIIRILERKGKTKHVAMMLYYAKKQRVDARYTQLDMFNN